jgi:hypothetical protein
VLGDILIHGKLIREYVLKTHRRPFWCGLVSAGWRYCHIPDNKPCRSSKCYKCTILYGIQNLWYLIYFSRFMRKFIQNLLRDFWLSFTRSNVIRKPFEWCHSCSQYKSLYLKHWLRKVIVCLSTAVPNCMTTSISSLIIINYCAASVTFLTPVHYTQPIKLRTRSSKQPNPLFTLIMNMQLRHFRRAKMSGGVAFDRLSSWMRNTHVKQGTKMLI